MNQTQRTETGEPATTPAEDQIERELADALHGEDVDQLMEVSAQQSLSPTTPASQGPGDQAASDPDQAGGSAGAASGSSSSPGGASGAADDSASEGDGFATRSVKRGRIHSVRGEDVFVELAGMDGKNQGVVPLQQFDRPPRPGSIMDFVLVRLNEKDGLYELSREGAVGQTTWEQLQKGSAVEARVVSTNKGGLELELLGGIRAFMPASQVDLGHIDDLNTMVGQKVPAVVQDIDRRGRKVVLSRRRYLEQKREQVKRKLMATLSEGDIVEGTVRSLMAYGAFVDLGGVDGLIHISDLSYARVDKPGDVVEQGQQVKVKVLKIDAENEKISLGLKQVEPDPWETVGQQLHEGDHVTARVVRLMNFGAFVEVEAGVEGLLPIAEMSWKRINTPSDVVQENQTLRLMVLSIDVEKQRMSLSLKQVQGDPWQDAASKFSPNEVVKARIVRTTDFGAFAELESGLEGLIHISELSPKRVDKVTDVVQVGQMHDVRVLEVDEENRRMRLSIKAVAEPPQDTAGQATAAEIAAANQAGGKGPQAKKKRQNNEARKGGLDNDGLKLSDLLGKYQ